MRAALRGLTVRGRSLVAAGLAAGACALVLGQRDLVRVAVFLIALPLIAAGAVSRTRYRLSCTRRLDPARVPVGHSAEIGLRLENVSRLPTGVLLVEDSVPYALGGRPRFVLDRLAPQRGVTVSYQVVSEMRGRYQVGPLTVRLTDPFGLAEVSRSFASADVLVITPQVHELPAVRLHGEWGGSGESKAGSVAAAGEDDVAPRQYRHGDDLRRVHWRSTARYGEIMVRREEQPWQSRAALLLDARARAHRGEGPGSSLEWAISAAASIGVHLSRAGYALRLVTDDAGELTPLGADPAGYQGILLDTLAVARPTPSATLAPAIGALQHGGGEGLLIAVLGAIDLEQAEQLARARQHGATTGVALMLDVATWTSVPSRHRTTPYDDVCDVLLGSGWRVLRANQGTALPALWREAGTRPVLPLPPQRPSEAATA